MPDLGELYESLADDANGAALTSPQSLRQRADRRARTRMAVAAAVTAVAVGVVGTAWGTLQPPPKDVAPAETPPPVTSSPSPSPASSPASSAGAARTSSPPSSPSSPARTTPTSIPATAMLKLPAANTSVYPDLDNVQLQVEAPCKAALPGSDQTIAQRTRETRFRQAGVAADQAAEAVDQRISVYRPGKAEAFMTQLRAAARNCPSEPGNRGTVRHVLVPLEGLGDDAFRIETTRPRINPLEEVDGEVTTFVTYVRIGSVVTVVNFGGWEGNLTPRRTDLRIVIDAAVGPFRAWLIP